MLKKLALLSTVFVMSLGSFTSVFAASVKEVPFRGTAFDKENVDYLTENEEDDSKHFSEYVEGNEKVEEVEFKGTAFDKENADYLTENMERAKAPTELFDWSKGEYSFQAQFAKSVGTKVLFSSSSTYYVNIEEAWEFDNGKNQYDKSNVSFEVQCYNASTNKIVSSHLVSGTGSKSLCFSNLDPKKSYYFVFVKDKVTMGASDTIEAFASGTISLKQ